MSHFTKVAGTWRNSKPYTKVAGTWKLADYVYNKVGGRWYTSFVKGGLVDRSWDDRDQTGVFGTGANTTVNTVAVQGDGKILIGGGFTTWNGTIVGRIVRLNANGTLDTTFMSNIGTGANSTVNKIVVRYDGKIFIGGAFTIWNASTSVGRLVCLNSDGTLDTAFMTNVGTGAGSSVLTIAIDYTDKIVLGGVFTAWNGSSGINRIVRLNTNGTRDTAFTIQTGTAANNTVNSVVTVDDQIIVGGAFTSWDGTTVGRIVRLNYNGSRDTSFTTNTGTGAGSTIFVIATDPDQRILIGGQFTTWNGATVGRVVRLSSTGVRDTTFTTNTGTGATSTVNSIMVQPNDYKILVGGQFTFFNDQPVGRFVRLNSNGTLDTTFINNTGVGGNNTVQGMAVESDNKILVVGDFGGWNNKTVNRIVCLNTDGTNFETLSTFGNSTTTCVAIQSDGKVIVGGGFTAWNGITVGDIVRLNANGAMDDVFIANTGAGSNNSVLSMAIQSDGKILVGGSFTAWDGITVGYIVRLNSDGTRDTTFTTNTGTGANSNIFSIAIQSDGKILVGGNFSAWNGTTVGRIVRLNSDGTRDTTFTTNTGTGASSNNINSIAIQSDGKILAGGSFSSWNGTTVGYIVRLNSDGTRDTTFTTNNGIGANNTIHSIAIQSDGKIVIGGEFFAWNLITVGYIVRLNSDGTRDTTFTTNTGTGASSLIFSIAIQSDGKILVGGTFTAWNGNFVGRVVRLNSDGTRDTAFTTNVGNGASTSVRSVTIQSDRKIFLTGDFTTFNALNQFRRNFVRIGGEDAS